MSNDEKYGLSRRKALLGLGTIGAAGAGAGFGTSALFSDTESFTNNQITAGTLDMEVTATIEETVDNTYWNNLELTGTEVTADGDAVNVGLIVDDAKPGDWAIVCFDITIEDNPGFVRIRTENLTSSENGFTEPEPEDSNSEGELDDAILSTLWSEYDGGGRTSLSGLDGTTNNLGGTQSSHSYDPSRGEGGVVSTNIEYTTLQEANDAFADNVVVGSGGTPAIVGSNYTDVNGSAPDEPAADEDPFEICLLLEIPTEVGNEIQGDSVSFDIVFESEQVRNNSDPFNGSSAVSNSTGS